MTDAADRLPPRREFIALMGILTALVAFSIDAMMPALPRIAEDLASASPNAAQLVVTSFVLGMGLGTFVSGPLSDQFGRKPVIVGGVALYIAASLAAVFSESMLWLLLTRLVQGLGASGPRVVVMAVIRDLYAGRAMAQIMSFIMIVFALIPALAPLMGAQILRVADWHAIFLAFTVFGVVSSGWFILRMPETLPAERRRPLQFATLEHAVAELAAHREVRLSIAVLSLCFGGLFATISSIQPIYEQWLGRGESFPLWFGLTAIITASSSYLNARLVVRLGMRRLVKAMFIGYISTTVVVIVALAQVESPTAKLLWLLLWQQAQFFQAGLGIGNLNAIALEPMGHIAGTAASMVSAVSTVLAVVLAVPLGLAFNGTPFPLLIGGVVFASLGLLLMLRLGCERAISV
ncbi:multidrug effflux MFS transporter [Sagittula sp. SSi028]|uniref:multidrug effflux MFS transporter n=1 Tax=Sagittula sp. SSi028 TaxID=3400636 RepID=UPI003AF5FC9B